MGRRGVAIAVLSCYFVAAAAHADVRLNGPSAEAPHGHAALQVDGPRNQGKASKPWHPGEFLQLSMKTLTNRLETTLHQWLHPLSAAAVITTIALQLSPLPSSMEIQRDRDVKRYDGYPYFAVLAGASQWCLYGSYAAWQAHDANFLTMVAANGPGVLLGMFYITNFFRFVPTEDVRNMQLQRYLTFAGVLVLMELACCIVLGHGAVFWLGLLGAIGSAQIALSPFKTLPEVLRTRSTRSWPLDLCFWNLIQSLFTGGFGLANSDLWVFVPNLIGVIAALFQMALIVSFWERSRGCHATPVKWKGTMAHV